MSEDIVVLVGNYHFGDNVGFFQNATYIGYELILPVYINWIDQVDEVVLKIETHDIETWGNWLGHAVYLNNREIGRLKDPNDTWGRIEKYEIKIPTKLLKEILGGDTGRALLRIVTEKQDAHPTLTDDFVLTRIDTVKFAMHIGSA